MTFRRERDLMSIADNPYMRVYKGDRERFKRDISLLKEAKDLASSKSEERDFVDSYSDDPIKFREVLENAREEPTSPEQTRELLRGRQDYYGHSIGVRGVQTIALGGAISLVSAATQEFSNGSVPSGMVVGFGVLAVGTVLGIYGNCRRMI